MKVLVVKLSAFGDIIHALPALNDLLSRPDVEEVHWLVDERYAFVTEIFPAAVQVHVVGLRGKQPLKSVWNTVRSLRSIGFDVVLDLQGLLKSAFLARAAGSNVYGIDRAHLREPASRWLMQCVPFHADERHVVQQYRRVAAAPFYPNPKQVPESALPYSPPRIDLAQTVIQPDEALLSNLKLMDNQYIILHTAGGWQTKQLPEQTWLNIAESLIGTGITPVFSWGSPSEKTQAQRLAGKCNGFALPKRLNMSALCSLLKQARAVVGADTGLLHLAAALETPTITFWGPSASWRSAPLNSPSGARQGDLHWHIESNPTCGPCFKRSCDHFVCMDAIDAKSIIRILHEL